ncbi:deoxyribonuclease IV [Cryptosporangium aurantiacum]|uniref:Probable endonuclease 4 n=1 Tax=Cryptosporangium aurantiacum TaxID=134849 RepID=A0A1M7IJW0_9ACTN|nr:deoxyribonuclease IV [Cryptosporangium aurantiacum]SHM41000.1 Endonuclease IV [Cryptosporangium aurantiacum]
MSPLPLNQPVLGAHVPASGGLAKRAIPYAERIGATTVQVFVSNPRGWALAAGVPAQDERFAAWAAERGIAVFIHATFLVNLGSNVEATVEKSVASLRHAVARGRAIGARGVVFHAGSSLATERRAAAYGQLREHLLPLLDELTPEDPDLLVEPTAGGGFALASRVEDLAEYFAAVDAHPRLRVCLDTCHAHAAGHDLAEPGGLTKTLDTLVDTVGPGRLALVHANDSRDPAGSLRDRHTTLGEGTIGVDGFAALFTHPAAAGVPIVVETPSEDDGAGHAADITLLRRLAAG